MTPEGLLLNSSPQSFLHGLQITVPQTQTSVPSQKLPWLPPSPVWHSAHITHTLTAAPFFFSLWLPVISCPPDPRPDLCKDSCLPGPLSSPSSFHYLNINVPNCTKPILPPGRGPLTSGGAVGQGKALWSAVWCVECPEGGLEEGSW